MSYQTDIPKTTAGQLREQEIGKRMREKYESLSVTVLRDLAKARGLRHLSGLKKSELVERMLQEDEKAGRLCVPVPNPKV